MSEHEPPPKVSSFMQTKVKTVSTEMTLDEVTQFLLSNNLSNAPVVEHSENGDYLIGFISERDCLAALSQEDFYGSPSPQQLAKTMMRSSPICVSPDTDVFSAASLLINHGYRHVPVADQGRLVGLVSRRDVLKSIVEYGQRYGKEQMTERFRPDPSQLINLRYLVKLRK